VTDTAVEPLPAEVAPEEAAPLLDSAKEEETGAAPPPAEPAPAEPAAPPPASDAEAQAAIQPPAEVQPVTAEQGEQAAPQEITFAPPPNVTIVNQTTVVNNTTVNNTTINNNNQPAPAPEPGQPNFGIQFVIQLGNQLIINNPEQDRDRYWDRGEDEIYYERLSNGRVRETITKPNGVQIVTVRNRYGDVLRRSKIVNGREYILAYFDEDEPGYTEDWRDPGEDLPPLRINIRADQYVLDADDADEEELQAFFSQPPVEQVRRIYTIDEVKRSARIRDSVRRLEVGDLTFDSGKATISRSQVGALEDVANAMLALLDRNPAETFLIEGHTDAVGGDAANLALSDLRAATVARILTDFYGVPPENLVTQGYGERFLKVKTAEAERLNRRVTIRRITPLITIASR
jgi:outer membrane protein OmpA-like peptidoglycan-associated protein